MNLRPGTADEKGSFLAVGTFKPAIEIWNLDVIDVLEPVASLGGRHPAPDTPIQLTKNKKKKRSKQKLQEQLLGVLKDGSHSDAVMCLGWHEANRGRLASGSADCTVKLWDLCNLTCTQTLTHHTNKVQSLQWNPAEGSVLLTGGYDHKVILSDVRSPQTPIVFPVDSDVESVCWSVAHPFQFMVSLESGGVHSFDARNPNGRSLFNLSAHERATTSIGSTMVNGLSILGTVGLDGKAKLWNITDGTPRLLDSKDLQAGPLFALSLREDVLIAGGQEGKVAVWHFEVGNDARIVPNPDEKKEDPHELSKSLRTVMGKEQTATKKKKKKKKKKKMESATMTD
jgi:periodic tryptophan protein 1